MPAKNGGVPCRGPQSQTKPCDVDCEVYYPEWDPAIHICNKKTGTRTQAVLIESKNNGIMCDPTTFKSEDQKCDVDCEMTYPDWSTIDPSLCDAQTGLLAHIQIPSFSKLGDGSDYPEPETEYRECQVDCVPDWTEWSACDKTTGFQTRSQFVSVIENFGGKACSALQSELQPCDVNCVMEFPGWDPLTHQCDKATGLRMRTQVVAYSAKNGGLECSLPRSGTQTCRVDCEATFPDWKSIPCTFTDTKTRAVCDDRCQERRQRMRVQEPGGDVLPVHPVQRPKRRPLSGGTDHWGQELEKREAGS